MNEFTFEKYTLTQLYTYLNAIKKLILIYDYRRDNQDSSIQELKVLHTGKNRCPLCEIRTVFSCDTCPWKTLEGFCCTRLEIGRFINPSASDCAEHLERLYSWREKFENRISELT